MPEISAEDTPIFTQLQQEYAARDKFAEIFGGKAANIGFFDLEHLPEDSIASTDA